METLKKRKLVNFITFKKYLIKHNILLFDADYRIAHFRFNNMIQTGGSRKVLHKITSHDEILLKYFIDSLLTNDNSELKFIKSIV
jgi:hypothetical protein